MIEATHALTLSATTLVNHAELGPWCKADTVNTGREDMCHRRQNYPDKKVFQNNKIVFYCLSITFITE